MFEKVIPEAPKLMREATTATLAKRKQYGPLLLEQNVTMTDGSVEAIQIVNFLTLLYAAYNLNGAFTQAIDQAIAVHGSTSSSHRFGLVLYSDECQLGNVLSAQGNRKIWCAYASSKEVGYKNLAKEDLWLPILIQRSGFFNKVAVSMGQIKLILLSIFNGPNAVPDLAGILLQAETQKPIRFHFDFQILVQDGASQKYTFGIRETADANTAPSAKK